MNENLEIVTEATAAAAELRTIADAIENSIDLVANHEDAFEEATLSHRLEIGLLVVKAQRIFTLSPQDRTAPATLSRRDNVDDEPAPSVGFAAWLGENVKRLKRPTAYKYAAAFASLGLDSDTATPANIKSRIKDIRHHSGKNNLPMPTLASLVKAAPKSKQTLAIIAPPDTDDTRLGDARETLHVWKEQWARFVRSGQLDDLTKADIEDLKEFQLSIGDQIKARLK